MVGSRQGVLGSLKGMAESLVEMVVFTVVGIVLVTLSLGGIFYLYLWELPSTLDEERKLRRKVDEWISRQS